MNLQSILPSEVNQIQKVIFFRIPFIQHPFTDKNYRGSSRSEVIRGWGGRGGFTAKGHENFCVLEIDLHIFVVVKYDCLHVSELPVLYTKMKEFYFSLRM